MAAVNICFLLFLVVATVHMFVESKSESNSINNKPVSAKESSGWHTVSKTVSKTHWSNSTGKNSTQPKKTVSKTVSKTHWSHSTGKNSTQPKKTDSNSSRGVAFRRAWSNTTVLQRCADDHLCLNGGTCWYVPVLRQNICACGLGYWGYRCMNGRETRHPEHRFGCPSDFVFMQAVMGCYKVTTRRLDWSAAGQACRSLHKDAHLLVINNGEEQSVVDGVPSSMRRSELTECLQSKHEYWLWTAGQRKDPDDRHSPFVWRVKSNNATDTVTELKYTNWHQGEPNNDFGRESCLMLWSGLSYTWNDQSCSHSQCSICEIDLN